MKVSPIRLIHNNFQELIAVDFGYSFRAEHQRGIDSFKKTLGVNSDLDGLEQYTSRLYPDDKIFFEKLDYKNEIYYVLNFDTWGIYNRSNNRKHLQPWFVDMFSLKYSDTCRLGINSAWDDHQFVIVAHEQYELDMKVLYNAFINKDILVGYSPEDEYHLGELKFSIKSKIKSLSAKVPMSIDTSGKDSFQHTESMIVAEDLIYESFYRENSNVLLSKRDAEKKLKDLSKKYRM